MQQQTAKCHRGNSGRAGPECIPTATPKAESSALRAAMLRCFRAPGVCRVPLPGRGVPRFSGALVHPVHLVLVYLYALYRYKSKNNYGIDTKKVRGGSWMRFALFALLFQLPSQAVCGKGHVRLQRAAQSPTQSARGAIRCVLCEGIHPTASERSCTPECVCSVGTHQGPRWWCHTPKTKPRISKLPQRSSHFSNSSTFSVSEKTLLQVPR